MTDCPIADKVPHSGRSWRELALSLGAWNTCGLSAERLQYVLEDLKQDVTVLSELHGAHTSRACSQFVTCGDPEAGDPAAGVGIALSKRAAGLVFDSGYIGSRIVWVKMRGWMCDMCVIGVYIPHRFRKRAPFQQDTLEQLRLFADSLPPSMCRVILGDFNCKIGRKETGQICGEYSMHEESCIGGLQLGDLMREQDLVATSTMFRPRKSLALGSATYINSRKVQKPPR